MTLQARHQDLAAGGAKTNCHFMDIIFYAIAAENVSIINQQ